jgi:predicted enzyme related to lactoylglutathione lyase
MWVDIAGDPGAAAAFYPALFGWRVERGVCHLGDRPVAGIRTGRDRGWVPSLPVGDVADVRDRIVRAGGRLGADGLVTDPFGAVFGLADHDEQAYEPGAPVWVEHRGRDPKQARNFYQDAFGYLCQQAGPAGYVTFQARTGGLALGGLGRAAGGAAKWITYFSVADTDDAARTVLALGGRVERAPEDCEFGRVATVADNQGVAFVLVSAVPSGPGLLTQTDKPIVTICG